jgi:invasion protein IalB
MKANIKQISFVLFGLIIITAIFALTRLGTATAAKQDGKKFDDWNVSCTPKDDKNETPETCMLTQQLNISQDDKQQPIALFQIGYFGEKKELKLVQTLPLGVSIQAGTSIISSKNLIAPGKYTTCLNNGCNAVASISDADLKTLLSNKDNSVAFMNLEGKQITLPLSIKGLEQGLKYIK